MYCVLVVDDEPKHRKGLVNIIKLYRPDYNVNSERCKKWTRSIEFVLSNSVDILITDIKMSIMDGLELTKKLMEYQAV